MAPKMKPIDNPLELEFMEIMNQLGVKFTRPEREGKRLDFHLTDYDLYVEVKAHPSPRVYDQMESVGNGGCIMVLCGPDSIKRFGRFLGDLR